MKIKAVSGIMLKLLLLISILTSSSQATRTSSSPTLRNTNTVVNDAITSSLHANANHAQNNLLSQSVSNNNSVLASYIVIGQAINISSEWSDDGTLIVTHVNFLVEEYLKGNPQGELITISYIGGEFGDWILTVSSQPSFEIGERAKVYLKEETSGFFTVFGGKTGKLSLAFKSASASLGYEYAGYHWPDGSIPVRYYINELVAPNRNDAVQLAFNTWQNDVGSYVEYVYAGTTNRVGGGKDGYNVVSWDSIDGEWGTLAETYIWRNIWNWAEIVECDIVFDEAESWSTTEEWDRFDVQNVAAHEAGHTLSLADLYDIEDSEETMYAYANSGETKKRDLHTGDIAGVRFIYPTNKWIELTGYGIVPYEVWAGDSFTASYLIKNSFTRVLYNIGLGLSIRPSSDPSNVISDPENDKVVDVWPGEYWYERTFTVPSTAAAGKYDAIYGVWCGIPGGPISERVADSGWHLEWITVFGLSPSSISVSVSPNEVVLGSGVTISGGISSATPGDLSGTVCLQYSIDNVNWNDIGSTTSSYSGEYSYWWTPSSTGAFYVRAYWNGNDYYSGAISSSVTLTVIAITTGEVELYYDDGEADSGYSHWDPYGLAVRFTSPSAAWRLSKIKVSGWYSYSDAAFLIEVWDKDFNELSRYGYRYSEHFGEYIAWAEIDIPDIIVSDDFYICIFPNYEENVHELWIGTDTDSPISGRSSWANMIDNHVYDSVDGDFMIRALGTTLLEDHTMCKDVQPDDPWDPIDRTNTFYTDDFAAYSWLKFVYIYSPSHTVKWEWYDPDDVFIDDSSSTIPDPASEGYQYWEWYKKSSGLLIDGYQAWYASRLGRPFKVKVYYDGTLILTQTWQVIKHDSSITCSLSSTTITYGQSVTVSSQLSPSFSDGTTTLQYSIDGVGWNDIASGTPSGGYYSYTWTPPNAGSYYLRAVWSGNDNYYGSTSSTQSLTVNRVTTSLTTALPSSTITYGDSVTITATMSPPISGKTVMVQFSLDASTWYYLSSGNTNSTGQYAYTWTPDAGTYYLRSTWSGDADYYGATSLSQQFIVNKAPTSTSCLLSSTSINYGESVNITATVSFPVSDGTITLQYSGYQLPWNNISSGVPAAGSYSYQWTPPATRTYCVRALWSGNNNLLGSSSANQTLYVIGTIYVPTDFSKIQEAINVASPGSTIYVYAGTYYENIVVNKTVSLFGENTIVDGTGGTAVYVEADDVVIKEFTIRNGSSGIYLMGSYDNNISGNIVISNSGGGIKLDNSYASISGNNITNNGGFGIELRAQPGDESSSADIIGNTIVNNGGTGISISGWSHADISGNNITNNDGGIEVHYDAWASITRNNIVSNSWGIRVQGIESGAVISGNNITNNNGTGIYIGGASADTISGNNITNNNGDGISISRCMSWEGYNVSGNHIAENNGYGVYVYEPFWSGSISSNQIVNNQVGVYLSSPWVSNLIYHNNLINNTQQVYLTPDYANSWNLTYPSGGNYWSDYNGTDSFSGPYQNITGSDSIGDTPYIIDANNRDMYPFMKPWPPQQVVQTSVRIAGKDYPITIEGNTTITSVVATRSTLHFKTSGPDGTIGYINVTFPVELNKTAIKVFVDDIKLTPPPFPIITTNSTHYFVHFEFIQSDHNTTIQYAIADIVVLSVTISKTIVGQGSTLTINVTIQNQGNYRENFNVTAYANATIIDTLTNITLTSGNSTTVTFNWNTTGVLYGAYTISATATTVLGEIDTSDNILIGGMVFVTITGDVNGDGTVDASDLFELNRAYGSHSLNPNWNPNYDLNDDGRVDASDLFDLSKNYGKTNQVPFGTLVTSASMFMALVAYIAFPKWKRKRK